jgi:L-alanine-DL-glutamate epimerase-like enolase superfamily enzyme
MPRNAVELIKSFSGKNSEIFEPFFSFSNESRITDVEIFAVGMNAASARYSSKWAIWKHTNIILRLKTNDGFEGVSGVTSNHEQEFSQKLLFELQNVITDLLELNTLDPLEAGIKLEKIHPQLSDAALSSIDIALWDLAARKAKLPLFKMLGGEEDSIEAYASLPFYDSLDEYINAINEYASYGYKIFKFHVWGLIEKDIQLVRLINETFSSSSYNFMIDLEGEYNYEEALKLGEELDKNLFIWLEAPINDKLLTEYSVLKKKLNVPILPDGYSIYSSEFIKNGIEKNSWSAGRFDATIIGGITKALNLLIIANNADLPIEIQSWGYTLTQAANLHLMLANPRTRFFENPMPCNAYEFGIKGDNLVKQGRATAPKKDGIGIVVDWDILESADFYNKVSRQVNE